MSQLESRDRHSKFIELISYLAVIFAVPAFFVQQYYDRESKRVEAALQLLQFANSPEYSVTLQRLSKPWENVDVGALMSQRLSANALAKFRIDSTKSVQNADIEQISDLYRIVISCRDKHVCDRGVIDDNFHAPVKQFYCSYRERLTLISRRLNRPDYSSTISRYVGSCE